MLIDGDCEICRIEVPLSGNQLGHINSYLLKTADGCILVDSGWNTNESFDVLQAGIKEARIDWPDIEYLIATHIHPDHFGLMGRLQELSGAEVVLHEADRRLLGARYYEYKELLESTDDWLRINGVPADIRPSLQRSSLDMIKLVGKVAHELSVFGGEAIELGGVKLEVIWTPGHSPGHICLYDNMRRMLLSGDHVIRRISSNVSMNLQTQSNPLADYLNALCVIKDLKVDCVFPGHGIPFTDLKARIQEITEHHDQRLADMLALCSSKPMTSYEIAQRARWFMPWKKLPPFSQRAAVTETLSHMELLLSRGLVQKSMLNGVYRYQAIAGSSCYSERI